MLSLIRVTEYRSAAGQKTAVGRHTGSLLVRLGVLLSVLFCAPQAAAELAPATGRVVLSVAGNIQHANADKQADFDYPLLDSLPQHEIRTGTPWTEGVHTYRGILLKDLLDRVGAEGKTMRAIALNDYYIDIPLDELRDYPVVLATHQDGRLMRIRDKGPVWLILPLRDYPELNTKKFHEFMAWQLRRLEIR